MEKSQCVILLFLQVLLPRVVAESVQDNLRIGLPNSLMLEGLLQSSQLKECHLTAVPTEWYREGESGSTADQEQW